MYHAQLACSQPLFASFFFHSKPTNRNADISDEDEGEENIGLLVDVGVFEGFKG